MYFLFVCFNRFSNFVLWIRTDMHNLTHIFLGIVCLFVLLNYLILLNLQIFVKLFLSLINAFYQGKELKAIIALKSY